MGHFFDLAKNVAIYDSPKTGGTSLRIWLHYLLTGELVETVRHGGYFRGTNRMLDRLRAHGYRLQTFVPPPTGTLVIRLVREPLTRFGSLVRDKVMQEGWRPPGHGPRDAAGEKRGPQLPFAEACECAMAFLTERCHTYRGANDCAVFLGYDEPCGVEAIPSSVKQRVVEFYDADMLLWARRGRP